MRFLLVASLLFFVHPARAQQIVTPGQVEIDALRGLDSLALEVKSDIERPGYEAQTIKLAIERRLKAENVPVVLNSRPHAGRLVASLSALGDVVLIRVRLFRLASMDCDKGVFFTSMWEREKLVRLKEDTPFQVSFLIDTFGADYNSINRR